jgi:DsbC/DsbD-like thiol-disulfide interchange protein
MQRRVLIRAIALSGALAAAATASVPVSAQSTATRHLTVVTSSTTETSAASGARVALVLDIKPKPSIHVYAPGQKDFIPVSLTLTPQDAVTAAAVQFPAAEKLTLKDLDETQLVYSKPFRIVQNVTIAPRALAGRTAGITIKGTLKYQACDDSICYAPVSVPVAWTIAPADRTAPARGKSSSR